jgi:ankyrin repeat protein
MFIKPTGGLFAIFMFALEIWLEIAGHLANDDYHKLRYSNKMMKLPLEQQMKIYLFRDTVLLEEGLDGRIHAELKNADDRFLYFLCCKNYFKEFTRVLQVCRNISANAIMNSFWFLTIQLERNLQNNPSLSVFQNLIHQGGYSIFETCDCNLEHALAIRSMISLLSMETMDLELLLHISVICGHESLFLSLSRQVTLSDTHTILQFACQFGFTGIVKVLLDDLDVDPSKNFHSAFITACKFGHDEIVSLLLHHPKICPSANENEGIAKAAAYGHYSVLCLLLNDPIVDPSCLGRNTPLIRAMIGHHIQCVKLLLDDERVDPSADDNFLLRELASIGEVDLIGIVLKDSRVRVEEHLISAAYRACSSETQKVHVLSLLLDCGVIDTSIHGKEFLLEAAEHANHALVLSLLQTYGVDPLYCGAYAFICACEDGDYKVAKYYMFDIKDFDPSIQNNLALSKASANGHLEIIELLLSDDRVNPSATSNYTISRNQYYQNTTIDEHFFHNHFIRFSLVGGFEYRAETTNVELEYSISLSNTGEEPKLHVNVIDDYEKVVYQNTAIRLAIQNGHIELAQRLITHPSIDLTLNNNEVLLSAIEHAHFELVEILLKHPSVDPSVPNGLPLRIACFLDCPEMIIRLFLDDSRVDPTIFDNQALQIACQEGFLSTVSILLQDKRIDPKPQIPNMLLSACEVRGEVIILMLIEKSTPTPLELIYLEYAVVHNLPRAFKEFVKYTPVTQASLCRLFILAISCGNWQMVEALLKMQIDLKEYLQLGLSIAFHNGLFEILRGLLSDGRFVGPVEPCDRTLVEYQYLYSDPRFHYLI